MRRISLLVSIGGALGALVACGDEGNFGSTGGALDGGIEGGAAAQGGDGASGGSAGAGGGSSGSGGAGGGPGGAGGAGASGGAGGGPGGAGGTGGGAGGSPSCPDADSDGQDTCSGDCDDTDALIFTGNAEICGDGSDNDCNGQVDENCPTTGTVLGTYVSDLVGDDANPGTKASPVKTIGQGMANAVTLGGNTVVVVAQGTYAEDVTVVEGISLRGGHECNGSSCTWSRDLAAFISTIADQDGDGVVFGNTITRATVVDGFEILGQSGGNFSPDGRAAVTILGGSPTLTNNDIQGPDNNGGAWRTGSTHAILINSASNFAEGALIANNSIRGGVSSEATTAVNLHWGSGGAVNVTLLSNVIRGGQGLSANAVALWGQGTGILIEDNDIAAGDATQDNAYGITGGAEATIRGNLINVNASGSCTTTTGVCGGLRSESSKMTITNNIILGIDAPNTTAVFLGEFEVPAGSVILNGNTLDGAGTSSSLRSSALVVAIGPCATCGFNAKVGKVRNNILIGGRAQARFGVWEEAPATKEQHPDFLENNLFYIDTKTASDHLYRYFDTTNQTFFDTIAEVNNLQTLEPLIGGAANNAEGDPNLGANYHLVAPSAASDMGTATEAPATDIDGDARPAGAGYDVGADEAG